jgi:hypothetical protein
MQTVLPKRIYEFEGSTADFMGYEDDKHLVDAIFGE